MDVNKENIASESSSLLKSEKINGQNSVKPQGLNGGHSSEISAVRAGEKSEPKKFKMSSVSKRGRYVLILCAAANFLTSSSFSLIGPFLPQEAARKGMSPTLTGFVFGIFQAVIFITSPFYGAYLTKIGTRFCYLAGIFVGGSATILFGLSDMCPSGIQFAGISLACRVVGALGVSGYTTASFAIVSNEFPDNIGTVYGVLETGAGLGFMLGPLVGGVLYDLGGFGLPFYIVGGCMLLNGLLIYKLLPHPKGEQSKKKQSIFRLIKIPMVFVPMCSLFAGVLGITSFDSTYSYHFVDFHLATSIVSIFFVACSFLYTTMSPLWAYLTDAKDTQAPLIIGGHVIFGLGFLVMGPSPLLPFITLSLWSLGISSALLGVSFGCLVIPTMKCMVNGAIEGGFENSIDTFALVSGLFNSINSLGGFLGPVACGALIQEYDYPIAYTVVALIHFVVLIVSFLYFTIRHFKTKRSRAIYEHVTKATDDEQVLALSGKYDIRKESTPVLFHPTLSRTTSISEATV